MNVRLTLCTRRMCVWSFTSKLVFTLMALWLSKQKMCTDPLKIILKKVTDTFSIIFESRLHWATQQTHTHMFLFTHSRTGTSVHRTQTQTWSPSFSGDSHFPGGWSRSLALSPGCCGFSTPQGAPATYGDNTQCMHAKCFITIVYPTRSAEAALLTYKHNSSDVRSNVRQMSPWALSFFKGAWMRRTMAPFLFPLSSLCLICSALWMWSSSQ